MGKILLKKKNNNNNKLFNVLMKRCPMQVLLILKYSVNKKCLLNLTNIAMEKNWKSMSLVHTIVTAISDLLQMVLKAVKVSKKRV